MNTSMKRVIDFKDLQWFLSFIGKYSWGMKLSNGIQMMPILIDLWYLSFIIQHNGGVFMA